MSYLEYLKEKIALNILQSRIIITRIKVYLIKKVIFLPQNLKEKILQNLSSQIRSITKEVIDRKII